MENVPRGSGGRRLFVPEFKREQVARLQRGEVSLAELRRGLGISRSVLQRWKHLITQGGDTVGRAAPGCAGGAPEVGVNITPPTK